MADRASILDAMETGGITSGKVWRGRRVLVTGGSGFIGSALVESLIFLGARVYVLAETVDFRRPLFGNPAVGQSPYEPLAWDVERIIHGDLQSAEDCLHAVAVSEPDFVFHLGALTQVTEGAATPVEAFKTNALGTVHLLDACRRLAPEAHIIVASSDKVYGEPDLGDLPFSEKSELKPVHPYDLSKACADIAARSMARYYGLQMQVTRLANVYGPGDTNWKRLIPGLMRDVFEDRHAVIRSDGSLIRQYLYITDATMAYLLLAQAMSAKELPNGSAWNFGPRVDHSVMAVWGVIQEVMQAKGHKVRLPIIKSEARDETDLLWVDSSRAEAAFAWKAVVDLETGIEATYDYIRRYLRMGEDQYQP